MCSCERQQAPTKNSKQQVLLLAHALPPDLQPLELVKGHRKDALKVGLRKVPLARGRLNFCGPLHAKDQRCMRVAVRSPFNAGLLQGPLQAAADGARLQGPAAAAGQPLPHMHPAGQPWLIT